MFSSVDSKLHGGSSRLKSLEGEEDVEEMHHGVHKNIKLHAEILKQHLMEKRKAVEGVGGVEDNLDLKDIAVEREDPEVKAASDTSVSQTDVQPAPLMGQEQLKQTAVENSEISKEEGNDDGDDKEGDDDDDTQEASSNQVDATSQKQKVTEDVKLQHFPPVDLPLARGYSGLPMEKTPALIGAKRGTIECDINVK